MKHASQELPHQIMNTRPNGTCQYSRYRFLELHDPSAALLSENSSKEILWTSLRPPREIAGALVENYQGAWIEPKRLIVRLQDEEWNYQLPDRSHTDDASLMRAVLIRHLQGHSPETIQRDLAESRVNFSSF